MLVFNTIKKMRMKSKITNYISLVLLIIFSSLTGCGSDGDSQGNATLKVIHNSPDAPNVDVLVDNSVALSNVPYGAISNDLPVESGERNISVNVAGTKQAVIEATLDLEENSKYLIFASDVVSQIKPIVLISTSNKPGAGNSSFRVLHGAPGAPAVDVYAVAPNASIQSETPILSNVKFGESSAYLTVPNGAYKVQVTLAGTKTVAIDGGSITLGDGAIYTVYAKDNVGGGAPFSLGIVVE
jgi:hypothetical protein